MLLWVGFTKGGRKAIVSVPKIFSAYTCILPVMVVCTVFSKSSDTNTHSEC